MPVRSRVLRRLLPSVVLPVVAVLVASTVVTACGGDDGSGDDGGKGAAVLRGGTWTLDPAASGLADVGVTVDLTFSATEVRGSSGCNRYQGEYRVGGDDTLTVDALGSTMIGCEPDVDELETEFLARLGSAESFSVDADTLRVVNGAGADLVLRR